MPAKEMVLLDVHQEVNDFLETCQSLDIPPPKLRLLMDQLFDAIVSYADALDDHNTLALVAASVAYGEGMLDGGQYEGQGLPPKRQQHLFEAVMQLGLCLRTRLVDLRLCDHNGVQFSHHFKEIERDHLLILQKTAYS